MAEHHVKLEITPRVVDLGDRVIQLHHVVSVGRHSVHPLRPAGLVVMAIGLGLIGKEVATRGAAAFALQAGGSLPLWIGFAALGISIFLLLYVRRVLSVQTSDGRRVELATASETAATDFILRMRHAMELAGGAAVAYRQGLPPSTVQSTGDPTVLSQRMAPSSGQARPDTMAAGMAAGPPSHSMQAESEPASAKTMPAGRHGGGYANGHAGGKGLGSGAAQTEASSITDQALQAYRRAGSGTASSKIREQSASAGTERRLAAGPEATTPATGSDPLSLPATLPPGFARDDGAQDLHALMEHVRRADVQHKEALLDLLRVVEDHYRGRASREDAVAHWRSFADYVVQYLSDVDGLIAHTERFGRHMLGR